MTVNKCNCTLATVEEGWPSRDLCVAPLPPPPTHDPKG